MIIPLGLFFPELSILFEPIFNNIHIYLIYMEKIVENKLNKWLNRYKLKKYI